MPRPWLRGAAAAIGLALMMSGVASGATSTVRMRDGAGASDNFFRPRTLRVEKGTRVVWRNRGARPHTSTSNSGLWDSDTLQPGQSFARRFRRAGTFRYHCDIHDGMTGKIVVTA
jgi:plastocyanin